MKKYYEVECRISKAIGITLVKYYYSNGFIILDGNKIYGCLTYDYFQGRIVNTNATLFFYIQKDIDEVKVEKLQTNGFNLQKEFYISTKTDLWQFSIKREQVIKTEQKIIEEQVSTAKQICGRFVNIPEI